MSVSEGTRERITEPVAPQESQAAPLLGAGFAADTPFGLNVSAVVSLQKTAGNAAVSALVGGGAGEARPRPPDPPPLQADLELAAGLADAARNRGAPLPEPAANGSGAVPMPDAGENGNGAVPKPGVNGNAAIPMPVGIAPAAADPTAAPASGGGAAATPAGAAPDRDQGDAAAPHVANGAAPHVANGAAPHVANGAAPHVVNGAAPHAAHAVAAHNGHAGGHAPAAHGHAGHAPAHESAPVDAGGDDLAAWQAAVQASTDNIAEPQLKDVTGSPDALAEHAAATEQERAAAKPDFGGEAKAQLPPDPKAPPPAEKLDTTAADNALALVDVAGNVRLTNQVFPPMAALPSGLAPPHVSTEVPPAAQATTPTASPTDTGHPDPNAQAAASKLDAAGPVAATRGPADGAVISDPGRASLDPLPPAQATHIGDVAARILAEAPAYAHQIVEAAAATLDPGKQVSSLTKLAEDLLPAEQNGLTAELQGVAAAAGVSAEQLEAKVAAKQAAAAQAHDAAQARLDESAAAAQDTVKQRGVDQHEQISGAGIAVREEAGRKQEAAKGASDPGVINGRRDAYLEKVAASVAAGQARLRAAQERRIADLQRIASEQKAAYAREAKGEANRATATAGEDPTAQRIAARPLLDWGEHQSLEVDGHLARLSRLAGEEVERHEQELKEAADTARGQIRDWAAEKQGRQRSWWERLLDMVTDYVNQAVASSQAWEAQRNAETRDQVASDLTRLATLRDQMASGNREAVMAELSRMSREERAVFEAFMRTGGRDAIGAVAAGLVERIKDHRVPELGKQLEEAAIAQLGWEQLNLIGAAQKPGFDAGLLAREVRGAVKGWGTDEKRLFAALDGHTRLQTAAMRKAYAAIYDRDMDEDINDDLSGSERERADALRSGDPTAAAVATLEDAMDGIGTDEATIMRTLRGKTPAERDAITAAYEKKYGHPLRDALKSEMSGFELGQADALLDGDTTKADAMALKDAMDGAGTDEPAIRAVYARIRDEVEADAAAKGMKTAEVEAEIKRRTAALKTTYGKEFAHGDEGALEADFKDEMGGGELKYALAAQAGDQTAMDAADLQDEHESMWTSDSKVNDILRNQYLRAKKEEMRDLAVDFEAQSKGMTPAERRAAWEQVQQRGDQLAQERSKRYMADLQASYNQDALLPEGADRAQAFHTFIENEVSGYDLDEARERIASGGKLSDAKELKYSIYGLGTKEQRIRETLKGKSKAEIEQIKAEYRAETGEELVDDLRGDLSGRDEADMTLILETGDKSPEEKLAYLKKRKDWELGQGTGAGGGRFVDEEARVLEATTKEAEAAFRQVEELKSRPEDDPERRAAEERLDRWLGYGDKDIERHREELDSVTDTIALVGGITVGIAVTALTGGLAAAPMVVAIFGNMAVAGAVAGALAAAATGMIVKQSMKGEAYGGEDIAIDMVQGTVDAIVTGLTFGTGEAAMRAIAARAPALRILASAAEGGALKRLAVKAGVTAVDSVVTGLPSGMMAAILDENTWKNPNPLKVILAAGEHGAEQALKLSGAMAGAHMFIPARGRAVPEPPSGATPHEGTPGRWPKGSGTLEAEPHPDGRRAATDKPPEFWPEGSGSWELPEPQPEDSVPGTGDRPPEFWPEGSGSWEQPQPEPDDGGPITGDEETTGRHPREIGDEPTERIPGGDPDAPAIEESPDGGFEPTTEEPVDDYGPEPPQEELDPEQIGEVPDDGVPDPIHDEPATEPHIVESPDGGFEPTTDEPAPDDYGPEPPQEELDPERIGEVPDDGVPDPIHDEPVTELPDGSVMYGGDGPLSHADADAMYENAWADSPQREVMIMEDIDTGERIVLQGDEAEVGGATTPPEVWRQLAEDRGGPGRYRAVRHSHGLGPDGRTPVEHRYPSGVGGDMSAARKDALRQFRPQTEVLDIVTERGREEIRYGYDQTQSPRAWWIEVPDGHGGYIHRDFGNLAEYHRWVERQTGRPRPILPGPDDEPAR